jgi:anti-sigma regulatory factor (Ser/Thr protein kinase)
MACDRTAAVLTSFGGRPLGDRDGRFLLGVGRSRPLVRLVRHDFRRWLEQAGLPAEGVSEVILACSEACANAVEHPHGAGRQLVEVEATLHGRELELRVRDFGLWKEQPGSPLRGRGLDMIRDLMDSLDVRRTPDGTEVVMRRSFST